MPPIWLNTNSEDSSTASEKIWVLYWPVCRWVSGGGSRMNQSGPAGRAHLQVTQQTSSPQVLQTGPACT